ncbi:uncharacterized protein TNCV_4495211 [Trichonephila clavipes]|nr:uncharacterized protein TNCV_4495211 [Trichonephila clavipes]
MTGHLKGFVADVKELNEDILVTHCFLHREALVTKFLPSDLKIVLEQCVKMVNYIKSRPLKSRLFSKLCQAMEAKYESLLLHKEHNIIKASKKAINTILKGIAAWAEDFKLTINTYKINKCIFSTDRRHRSTLNIIVKIKNFQICKVDFPSYPGAILDPELNFTNHGWDVMCLSVVQLKTHLVKRPMRRKSVEAQTSSYWCGVEVQRGDVSSGVDLAT